MKQCATCKKLKPLNTFGKHSGQSDGLQPLCKDCRGTYNRAWSLELRRSNEKLILELKKEPCVDCGNKFPSCCMEFDHVPGRGKKIGHISDMMSYSKEMLLLEIEKCDLICSNCHKIRTFIERDTNKFKQSRIH
jgi:hypothetical protein